MIDTPMRLKLSCCGDHPERTDLSCYKIRRLDGTALTVAEVWAELTAAQAEIAELRAKCERLEEVLHDGHAVFKCLTPHEQKYTSADNVSSVLDAFKRALKSANPGAVHE